MELAPAGSTATLNPLDAAGVGGAAAHATSPFLRSDAALLRPKDGVITQCGDAYLEASRA